MLIRSQDKKHLINMITMGAIYCNGKNIYVETLGGDCLLGVYSTEGKTIKVLDMIEERTNEPIYINDIGNGEYSKYLSSSFQMPQDEEV